MSVSELGLLPDCGRSCECGIIKEIAQNFCAAFKLALKKDPKSVQMGLKSDKNSLQMGLNISQK